MNNPNPSSRDDWQFGITFSYPNYAALDGFGAKNQPITLKHYGTAAARTAANEARGKLRGRRARLAWGRERPFP